MIDKHRRLHLLTRASVVIPANLSLEKYGIVVTGKDGPLYSNTEICRWHFDIAPPLPMQMDTAERISVLMGEGTSEEEALLLLHVFVSTVTAVIGDFRQFFAAP
jgi:hypothetical protein